MYCPLKSANALLSYIFLVSGLILLTGITSFGQVSKPYFPNLTTRDGLPNNVTHCFLMDSRGFMWFGTNNGLARWDGLNFKYYFPEKDNPLSLSHPAVFRMVEDKNGFIWIGTIGGGLNKFDPEEEKFTTYIKRSSEKEGYTNTDEIVSLLIDSEDQIWAGTYNAGFNLFDPETGKFQNFAIKKDLKDKGDAFRKNSVMDIKEYHNNPNLLWLAVNNGLFLFNKKTKELQSVPKEPSKREIISVQSLWVENEEYIWLATYGSGIARVNIATEEWTYFLKNPEEDTEHRVILDLAPKSANELWISSKNAGTGIFNIQTGRFSFLSTDCLNIYANSGDIGHRVYVDRQKRLWAGNGSLGVRYLNSGDELFQFISLPRGDCNTSPGVIKGITYNTCTDKIYAVGTACDGFFEINPSSFQYKKIPIKGQEGDFTIFNAVLTDSKCRTWVGTQHIIGDYANSPYIKPSLYQYQAKDNKLLVVEHPKVEQARLQEKTILDLFEDSKERIWIGTSDGHLIWFDLDQNELKTYIVPSEPLPNDTKVKNGINAIKEDKAGKLWLITEGDGLWNFDPEEEQFYALRDPQIILQQKTLEVSEEKVLYIGSTNGFLAINYDYQDNEPQIITIENIGISGVDIMHIDQNNNLWVGTRDGLLLYEKSNVNEMRRFGKEDGLVYENFHEYGIHQAPNGQLLVGQTEGLGIIHPDSIPNINQEPNVVSLKLLGLENTKEKYLTTTDYIELEHYQNFFNLSFTLLNFTRPKENQFAYMLEGFDKDWVYLEKGQYQASYTKVPPGNYKFRLKACSFRRKWIEMDQILSIKILPPWWQTWWAKGLSYLGLFAIAFGIFRVVRNRQLELEERNELLEERAAMEKETINLRQAALNAQMNPHFIFNCLNSIQSFVIQGDSLNSSRYLSKFAQLVRETLHTSMESSIRLEEEVKMLENYLELEKLRHEMFSYKIEIAEELNLFDTELPPLLVQPIVENAILHGLVEEKEDGFVHVHYKKEADYLVVEVIDNGIGIAASQKKKQISEALHQSVGMKNTQKRLHMLGNTKKPFVVETLRNAEGTVEGTKVIMRIKLEENLDEAYAKS